MRAEVAALAATILRCARSKDERGRWQAERDCRHRLPNPTSSASVATAEACRNVGRAIAQRAATWRSTPTA